jgi:CheY-like chemotaxis protein
MIVDDHPAFRQVLKTTLLPLAAEVVECEDGAEAVRRFPETQPDVVLMDIALPGLDGIRATAQIKARFPKARILIVTQYDDPDFRAATREAGACGYVVKDDLSPIPAMIQKRSQADVSGADTQSGNSDEALSLKATG